MPLTNTQAMLDDSSSSDVNGTLATDVDDAVDALDASAEKDAVIAAITALDDAIGLAASSREGKFPWGDSDNRKTG